MGLRPALRRLPHSRGLRRLRRLTRRDPVQLLKQLPEQDPVDVRVPLATMGSLVTLLYMAVTVCAFLLLPKP